MLPTVRRAKIIEKRRRQRREKGWEIIRKRKGHKGERSGDVGTSTRKGKIAEEQIEREKKDRVAANE